MSVGAPTVGDIVIIITASGRLAPSWGNGLIMDPRRGNL